MKFPNNLSIILFISLIIISCTRTSPIKLDLNKNWSFKKSNDTAWLNATVTGCVHTDLLQNNIIEDPFYRDNEQSLQWISETDWEYKTSFDATEVVNYKRIELVFEGLDTYADVYLNDSLIMHTDNMFREWTIDIKDLINSGRNDLYIRFFSPFRIEKDKASKVTYKLPDERGFTRKAPYQYGWDWGPRFVTSGIWRPVYLRFWNKFRIKDIQVVQKELSEENARISAIYEIEAVHEGSVELIVVDNNSNQELGKVEREMLTGSNFLALDFTIENPELWWTNGLGDAYLYDLSFIVKSRNNIDEVNQKIGLRTLELVQTPDSIGSSFHFELNGVPVFMKGANYIPQDNFPSRVTEEKYQQTIQTTVDANMNMLRVWGGGIYENDIFYELCDENGILVWQDFMFACNMYPGDEPFIENVKQEAIQNVKRLRNHPCIAIWCGNNEVDEGWRNWGWQKALEYSETDSIEVWNNYQKIFEEILPQTVFTYSPTTPYTPSSPRIGWGHEEALTEGDMHYWGVWWGEEPFEVYEKKVGRFMTEYGFQGFPDLRTLDSCLLVEDLDLSSAALKNHQKHPRGMELIQKYMEREYKVPDNFEDYAYVSQLVQAYGIKTALEAHRRAKPYCMGTLYWQLNDCWPVISWSSVDYYNRWKALHYFTKKTFEDILISFEEKDGFIDVYIVSDNLKNLNANFEIGIINFDGKTILSKNSAVEIVANSSKVYEGLPIPALNKENHLLTARLIMDDKVFASNIYYFLPAKDLKLPKPNIQMKIINIDEGYQITLNTDKLAKNVFLYIDAEGHFSDNYFDLLPGEEIHLAFKSKKLYDSFEEELKVISLADIY